ncbi:helix-turn-helix domain-containing protein [Paenibacillus sp. CAU 1782]
MSIVRTIEHYEEQTFFGRHPDIYVAEAEESLWLMEHDHEFVELVLVAEGRGTHYLNGEPVLAEAGDLFAIPVGTRHIFRPPSKSAEPGNLKVWNLLLTKACLNRMAAALESGGEASFLLRLTGKRNDDCANSPSQERNGNDEGAIGLWGNDSGDCTNSPPKDSGWLYMKDRTSELRQRFRRLSALYAQYPGASDSLAIWSEALGLLSAVYRETNMEVLHGENSTDPLNGEEKSGEGAQPSEGPQLNCRPLRRPLANALAYIRANYAKRITIADAAAAAGMGERQLRRLFADWDGRSFRDCLEETRVAACCRLLAETELPIMELSQHVGYEQWKSLSRVFLKRKGISMSEYRRTRQA